MTRIACPDCGNRRWLRISTDGNGGTRDELQKCENPNCGSNMETRERGQRLTPEEREIVMQILREDPKRTDKEVAAMARARGITISDGSIGVTYRPKLRIIGNGNGAHNPAAAPAATIPPIRMPRAAAPRPEPEPEPETLPYQIYQLENGNVQVTVDLETTPRRALQIIAAVNAALS